MNPAEIKLTIAFTDPALEPGEREEQAQRLMSDLQQMDEVETVDRVPDLMSDLQQMDEVETVDRVPDPNPPQGSKAFGSVLMGLLTAEVSVANAKKLLGFLGDRLSNKPIELSVEANGKKLSVKAGSREELEAAIKAAQDFIAS